jgi:3-dehydro-L-gulonate-6-phosphate decarboxylase
MTPGATERRPAGPLALGTVEHQRTSARIGRKVQVALDTRDLPAALSAAREVALYVDVLEVGTAHPSHILLADIRVAEAGALLSRLAFEAGADLVTVVSGAAPESFAAVAGVAAEFGADVQVELSDGWTWQVVEKCRDLGIRHFILHRSRDAEMRGDLSWSAGDLDAIARIAASGGRVSVTGGLSAAEVSSFADYPVEIFIAGRALYGSVNPMASAREFAAAVAALPALPAQQRPAG